MINHCPLFCNDLAGSDRLAKIVEIICTALAIVTTYCTCNCNKMAYNNEFNTPVLKCSLFVHVTVSMNFLLF